MKMATKISITALIHTPLAELWDKWTKPEHITQWNFAHESWQYPKAENDLRVGGKYMARMEAKDGGFCFNFEAVYDVVKFQEESSYTMGDGRTATTIFEKKGESTQVTTSFNAETQNPVEMQEQGWQAILNNFKKYAES